MSFFRSLLNEFKKALAEEKQSAQIQKSPHTQQLDLPDIPTLTSYFSHSLSTSYQTRLPIKQENNICVDAFNLYSHELTPEFVERIKKEIIPRKDLKKYEEDDEIPLLIIPRTLRNTRHTHIDDKREALLAIPTLLHLSDYTLHYPGDWISQSPWIPRSLLDEGAGTASRSESEILFGMAHTYDHFVDSPSAQSTRQSIDDDTTQQWKSYIQYCLEMYNTVIVKPNTARLETHGIEIDETSTYFFLDTSVNASANISRLYEYVRRDFNDKQLSTHFSLYRTLLSPIQKQQRISTPQRTVELFMNHQGAASRQYPLASSQRTAIHEATLMNHGDVLAISGPPGTGKTTLLQSIVADLLVKHALAGKNAPIIVASSANNQAVTNIIDAFAKDIPQNDGLSVFRRWLPDLQYSSDTKKFHIDDAKPLHSLGVYSPSKQKHAEAIRANQLVDEASQPDDGLYGLTTSPEYSAVAAHTLLSQAAAYFSVPFSNPSDAATKLHKRLHAVEQKRRELITGVNANMPKQKLALLIQDLTAFGAVDAQGNPLTLEDCVSPEKLDAALDYTVRPLEFWLAVHYFEARWLALPPVPEDIAQNKALAQRNYHDRIAFLAPLTVMTFYRLASQFTAWNPQEQAVTPAYGHIDLLIADEAGQVPTPIAAASFALAKKAIVVGDIYQIPPVWDKDESQDFRFAHSHGAASNHEVWNALKQAGLTSSEPSSLMSAAQFSSNVAHEIPSTVINVDGSVPAPDIQGGLFLSEHRRCLDSIIDYCNKLVYKNRLEPKRGNTPDADTGLPPMGYCHVSGTSQAAGTSRKNSREAEEIAAWIAHNLPQLAQAYPHMSPDKVIGVVTPFKAQANEIKEALGKYGTVALVDGTNLNLRGVTVGTAHSLQGAERPIILFSLVYDAASKAGFVENSPNLMNVAVSRAKDSFIVFCDESQLVNASGDGVLGWLKYFCYTHGKKIDMPQNTETAPAQTIDMSPWKYQKILPQTHESASTPETSSPKQVSDDAVSLTKAIKRGITAGYWPSDITTAQQGNILLNERGILEQDGGRWKPTSYGESLGVRISQPNSKGDTWPVYNDETARQIASLLTN